MSFNKKEFVKQFKKPATSPFSDFSSNTEEEINNELSIGFIKLSEFTRLLNDAKD